MKKLVALILAVLMVTSLFTVASAEALKPFDSFEDIGMNLFIVADLSCTSIEEDTWGVHMQYMAQRFVPAESEYTGVNMGLRYGSGSGVMHLEIRDGGANGEAIFEKDVDVVAKGDVSAWYTFDFGQTVTLTPGKEYALAFWFLSKTTKDFCYATGNAKPKDGLDLWRHKRFAHGEEDPSEGVTKGDLYELADVTLKETIYTLGFEMLTPDRMAANQVEEMIAALPSKVTVADAESIYACVTAYGALSEEAKGRVMNLDAMNTALAALNAAQEQYAKDLEEATKVENAINALPTPTDVTVSHTDVVEEVRDAYNALTKDQKDLVSKEAADKLKAVVAALKVVVDAEAVAQVEALIEALPTPTDLTIDDIENVLLSSLAYDELTDAQKAMVDETLVEKLIQILAVIEDWNRYDMGDVNADGKVDAKDALFILKVAVEKETPSYIQWLVGDIDASGKLDAKDALEVLKFVVEKPSLLDEFYAPAVE